MKNLLLSFVIVVVFMSNTFLVSASAADKISVPKSPYHQEISHDCNSLCQWLTGAKAKDHCSTKCSVLHNFHPSQLPTRLTEVRQTIDEKLKEMRAYEPSAYPLGCFLDYSIVHAAEITESTNAEKLPCKGKYTKSDGTKVYGNYYAVFCVINSFKESDKKDESKK